MKNLKPLKRNYSYYQQIASRKDPPARSQLSTIEPDVRKSYSKYVKDCKQNNLSSYTVSLFNGFNAEVLRQCYSKTKEVAKLKEDIYNNQPIHLQYECQYCTIGDSGDSLDHYLPKELFPEFSVHSNNLIPCCSRCNSYKSVQWIDAGAGRNIINFYYDLLPVEQFLFCEVKFRRKTPIITFRISNPGTIDPSLYRTIDRHFARLRLLKRFQRKANTEITNIVNAIKQHVGTKSVADISLIILRDSAEMKVSFGNNYWKAVLKETIAGTDRFFINLGFTT